MSVCFTHPTSAVCPIALTGMTISRRFEVGSGLSERSLTDFSTLQVEMNSSEVAQLDSIDPAFRPAHADIEEELEHAADPSQTVLVDVSTDPVRLLIHEQTFLEIPYSQLPDGWATTAARQGACYTMLGSGTVARVIWAAVRS